ncbi:thioredoxin domain-containing protein [Candidatus Peregrinibacteria bacterium]|nr:thioredoxin domain-containing protein [Candidatus Peregrinibacteria bacterium]
MKKPLLLTFFILVLAGCGSSVPGVTFPQVMNPKAAVFVEEFSDLQCPACAFISPVVTEIVRRNPGIIKLAFYHFPLSYHPFAFIAAEAAECAADQGKFWEFMDTVYKNQSSLNEDFLYSVADQLGLNAGSFKTCMETRAKKTVVQMGFQEGRDRQIPGTPTLFVNGKRVQWAGEEAFEGYVKGLAE